MKIFTALYVSVLYARYLCSRAHSAKRARDDIEFCILVSVVQRVDLAKKHYLMSGAAQYCTHYKNLRSQQYLMLFRG